MPTGYTISNVYNMSDFNPSEEANDYLREYAGEGTYVTWGGCNYSLLDVETVIRILTDADIDPATVIRELEKLPEGSFINMER